VRLIPGAVVSPVVRTPCFIPPLWTSPCEKWAPESAEAFSAADRGVEWDHDRVAVVGWQVAAALMGQQWASKCSTYCDSTVITCRSL
jgi:hypothetical protein